MFFPLRTDTPLRQTPWMNWGLILANIIAYGVQTAYFGSKAPDPFGLSASNPHVYQFFTSMFLHGSISHIFFNMLFLYIFGNNVNDKIGHLGYLALYLAGGVFAGIGWLIFERHGYAIGASGAIWAVTGAYLALLPRSHVTVFYFWFIIGFTEIASLWFVIGFFALEVLEQVGILGGGGGVAHMAHIAGAIFGFFMCLGLLAGHLLPRDIYDVLALIDRWNRRRQHRDAVAKGYDPFAYAPKIDPRRPPQVDPRIEQIHDVRAAISEALAQQKLEDASRHYRQLLSIDPQQVLARQSQLDVANQLFAEQDYPAAAAAYELYLRSYPKGDQIEHVHLMCGIIYGRYLNRYADAKRHLDAALPRLHATRDLDLAKSELARIEPLLGGTPAV